MNPLRRKGNKKEKRRELRLSPSLALRGFRKRAPASPALDELTDNLERPGGNEDEASLTCSTTATTITPSSSPVNINNCNNNMQQENRMCNDITSSEIPDVSIISDDGDDFEDMIMVEQDGLPLSPRSGNGSIVIRPTPPRPPQDLGQAIGQWVDAVRILLESTAMRNVLLSSLYVFGSAGDACVQTALLPVKLPMQAAGQTRDMMVFMATYFLKNGRKLLSSSVGSTRCITNSTPIDVDTGNPQDSNQEEQKPSFSLLGALTLPARVVLDVSFQLGSVVSQLVTQPPAKRFDARDDDYLDRLRLDYVPPSPSAPSSIVSDKEDAINENPATTSICDSCRGEERRITRALLLNVFDLEIVVGQVPLRTIDLADPQISHLIMEATDRLVSYGLSLVANHPTVRLAQFPVVRSGLEEIAWKAEGSSGKLLKRMSNASALERFAMLQSEILIWSGRRKSSSEVPFYLARGILPYSPRGCLNLLWDNARTPEYNHFCLGRKTVLDLPGFEILDCHDLSDTTHIKAAKVIHSETRVPFTSLSVGMECIMHARSLVEDNGYVIVSRSIDTQSKNEIVWGINVFRRVPNHPHCCDLTSLSQVKSSLVPQFLAHKIGIMGIEDFFKNMRHPKVKN